MKTGHSTGLAGKSNEPSEPQIVALDPENHDDVALLAYKLWQQRGCFVASDLEDWFRAENQLKTQVVFVTSGR
jgi:hypothetical protein